MKKIGDLEVGDSFDFGIETGCVTIVGIDEVLNGRILTLMWHHDMRVVVSPVASKLTDDFLGVYISK